MTNVFGNYLLAFKNIFDYKHTASRSEFNWFILFMALIWILMGFLFMGIVITNIVLHNDAIIPILFGVFFVIGGLYMLAHLLPFLALMKRRCNTLFPQKSGTFFFSFLGLWLVQQVICITLFIMFSGSVENANPIAILPLAFVGQIFGFLFLASIVFLMIREKPFS